MLRLGIFIAALIGVFLAALSLMPRFLSPSAYRTEALVGLTRALGQPVEAGEGAAIRFLPRPKLQLVDVRVLGDGSNTDEILLSADTATFDLRGRALATGQIQVEAVELDRPVINLTRSEDQSVTFGAAPLFSGLTGQSAESSSLVNLTLKGGEIRYTDEPFGQDFRFDIDEMLVQRVNGYAFEAKGRVLSDDQPFDVAVSFVPNANPGSERGFDIEVKGADAGVYHLRGAVDDKFSENLIIREDLDWKLTAENFQHPLFERLALADGKGVTLESRVLSDREGYDFQGLTLTRESGEQMRGNARFVPGGDDPQLDLMLTGKGLSLSEAAADLPLRDWTALLPGAVEDLGGLSLNFDVKAQDVTLPNGTVVERLTTVGTLREEGLEIENLKGTTAKGLSIDLDSLASAGPDDLRFSGQLNAQDARPFIPDETRAALLGSLGQLQFEGSVAMNDGELTIEEGTVKTAQGEFTVDGAPFSLDATSGFGDQGVELVTDNLDLNAWVGDEDLGDAPTLADQGKAIANRMKALGTNSLSLAAETANFGGRILNDVAAEFTAAADGKTGVEASFTEDDGTAIQTNGVLSETGDGLESGSVTVVFNDEPRAAEKMIERFAPQASENDLVTTILDRLEVDGLALNRTEASNPWELTLNSGETQITGSDFDDEGNRFWSFRSTSASDLFQALDIPLSPDVELGGVDISGRQSLSELVGIGSVLGADITLQELGNESDDSPAADRAFKLNLKHEDAQAFLAALGFDLTLPSNGPIDIDLSVSRLEQNYGYQLAALLGEDVRVDGNGFYSFETRSLGFEGTVNHLAALPWLKALFVADAEDSVLSPLLSALSGSLSIQFGELTAGQIGAFADAELNVMFEPGRYEVSSFTGTLTGGPFDGGEVLMTGDLLAGDDLFADMTLQVADFEPSIEAGQDTALTFDSLTFATDSLQARANSIDGLLAAANASFEVEGQAALALALTSINASETMEEGVWREFLSFGEGINAYEDLRALFFDGAAELSGVVVLRDGSLRTNTLALKGRQGTLLAKGMLDLETQAAKGFTEGSPLRIELYRAEDDQLVEQVLLLSGPLGAPETLAIER